MPTRSSEDPFLGHVFPDAPMIARLRARELGRGPTIQRSQYATKEEAERLQRIRMCYPFPDEDPDDDL